MDFAVKTVNFTDQLPRTHAETHIAGQLLRSGMSPAAQYAEARGAESIHDFIHGLRICLDELNESHIWLKIIARSNTQPDVQVNEISQECEELCRIINASIQTAKKRIKA